MSPVLAVGPIWLCEDRSVGPTAPKTCDGGSLSGDCRQKAVRGQPSAAPRAGDVMGPGPAAVAAGRASSRRCVGGVQARVKALEKESSQSPRSTGSRRQRGNTEQERGLLL